MTSGEGFAETVPATDPPAHSSRPRVWTVFTVILLGLILAIGFQAIVGIVLAFVEMAAGTTPAEIGDVIASRFAEPLWFMVMLVLGQAAFAIACLVPAALSPVPFRERIGWRAAQPAWHVYPVAVLSSLLPLALGLWTANALQSVLPGDESLGKLFDSFTIATAIPFVILIGLLPGLIEEVFYRGYVQQRLVQRWGAWSGVIVSSLLFALVHLTPLAIVAVVPLGLWFGYISYRSQSILPTIFCHAFVNSGLNAWRMVIIFGEISETVQWYVHAAAVIVGTACCLVCLLPSFWKVRPMRNST